MSNNEERALIPRDENPLALMQAIDVGDIVKSDLILPDLKENGEHPWAYSFKQQGQLVEGLGVDGVEDACRALASKGEIIQEMDCRLEMQDDREAFFIAKAGRFAIAPDGQHIGPLDTSIRALRQPKYIKLRDNGGEKFNEKWFEVGVAKANRNAKEALIPEALKQKMLTIAREAKRAGQGQQQRNERQSSTNRARQDTTPRSQPPAPSNDRQEPPAVVAPPPPGARWEDLQLSDLADADANGWAKPIFKQHVEDCLGANKCRVANLKLELANPGDPPLASIDDYGLGDIVSFLRQKYGKEPLPSAAPQTDPPTDAEYTEGPPNQGEIDW